LASLWRSWRVPRWPRAQARRRPGLEARETRTVPATNLPGAPAWPAQFFALYIDIEAGKGLVTSSAGQNYDFAGVGQQVGVKYLTLGFVTSNANGAPGWDGVDPLGSGTLDPQIQGEVDALRALGGDVMVSFGGADENPDTVNTGKELALVAPDAATLQRTYQGVIDAYQLTHIDFDIEGNAVVDHASIDRRSQAIAGLQAAAPAGKPLQVWFTLPVGPGGLDGDGLYVLQSALSHGVDVGGVNLMTMDYTDAAVPNPQGQMGNVAVQAATALVGQLHDPSLYGNTRTDAQLWQMVGLTPMIGLNDVAPGDEVFTQQDAQKVLAFARQQVACRISMWSLNRDQPDPTGGNALSSYDSSIPQQSFEFSQIFRPFTSGADGPGPAPTPPAPTPPGPTQPLPSPAAPPAPVAGDVTALVDVPLTAAVNSPRGRSRGLTQTLMVRNRGAESLEGPLRVVLLGLKGNVKLRGAGGIVGGKRKKSPFVMIDLADGVLRPGDSVSTLLRFSAKPNTFTVAVFAGTSPT
jgi:hypothetical protein